MGAARKSDLERRLEAYFGALHSSSLKETLKRSLANWQIYAAVSGSAMAMVTGASASIVGSGVRVTPAPTASVRVAKQNSAGSKGPPFIIDVGLVVAQQGQRGLPPGVPPKDETRGKGTQ
jgi:hypothetical protein